MVNVILTYCAMDDCSAVAVAVRRWIDERDSTKQVNVCPCPIRSRGPVLAVVAGGHPPAPYPRKVAKISPSMYMVEGRRVEFSLFPPPSLLDISQIFRRLHNHMETITELLARHKDLSLLGEDVSEVEKTIASLLPTLPDMDYVFILRYGGYDFLRKLYREPEARVIESLPKSEPELTPTSPVGALEKFIRDYHVKIDGLTCKQLAEAIDKARGDFQRYVKPDGAQSVVYIPGLEADKYKRLYNGLLNEVEDAHPGENRHETARRILRAWNRASQIGSEPASSGAATTSL